MGDCSYLLSRSLGEKLKAAGMKVAVAESCTGGSLSKTLTDLPGSSLWFDRGFVTYSDESKIAMLGIAATEIEHWGAVSETVAIQMAKGVIHQSVADISASITGFAGPEGGTRENPVGTVYVAIASREGHCTCRKLFFTGGRQHIRESTVAVTLQWLNEEVERRVIDAQRK
ncbi:MAG: hypothetical protein A3F41_06715 [Coxiella sp. RIFCSPHIGHO2_12_FULL_44_14]|nr:MAG: hypothetical protein A3F41_06715 [Coxiella sp. RIFCSPHIGHO2_12_FULL_44_14]